MKVGHWLVGGAFAFELLDFLPAAFTTVILCAGSDTPQGKREWAGASARCSQCPRDGPRVNRGAVLVLVLHHAVQLRRLVRARAFPRLLSHVRSDERAWSVTETICAVLM